MRKNINFFTVIKTLFIIVFLTISILLCMSCDGCNKEPDEPIENLPYVLSDLAIDVNVGETHTVQVLNLKDGDTVTWESSNTTVVAVSSGIVTALKPGSAIVTAIIGDTKLSCTVTSTLKMNPVPVFEVENIQKQSGVYALRLIKGETFTVSPVLTVDGEMIGTIFNIKSANENAVTVDGNTIKADAYAEQVNVTISCEYEGETYSLIVVVTVKGVA